MNILYAFDDLFAEVAGISILSLFENNKDADEINVYAICDGVSDINKQRLITLSEDYGRKIIFLDAPDVEKIAGTAIKIQDNYTLCAISSFYRLFISSILPPDMKKIIYIDSDTTIHGSLSELWNMEQGGNIVSGVRHFKPKAYINQQTFLKRRDLYINAGVMLINLDLWRFYDVEAKFIKFIMLMDGKILFYDQGVLNTVLKGYIGCIDRTWNYVEMVQRKKFFVPRKVWDFKVQWRENPVIRHYLQIRYRIDDAEKSGENSSWIRKHWYKWREMSPWRGLPLEHLRSPRPQSAEHTANPKRKTIRSSILHFTEKNCKPLYSLLSRLGIYLKAFLRRIKRFFREAVTEPLRIRKYNKHRQKVTGINIKDCRITTL
ncbi:MAG: glycosyltransferase family 8 protein [Oscillospiraceae bacterium]|nr:glycosyltransferase family 8 protein [Oscillospiraceae bacterium]